MFLHMFEAFERVDFAREFVRVAVTAIRVQHECAGRCELAGRLLPTVDKVDFAEVLAAAVPPEIEPMRGLGREVVFFRNDEAVRLHAAVDLRAIPANDEARFRRPTRFALLKFGKPFVALFEQRLRHRDFLHVEELVVFERVFHGLAVNLDVGDAFTHEYIFQQLQPFDTGLQRRLPRFQFLAVGRRHRNAFRRNGPHVLELIILWPIGRVRRLQNQHGDGKRNSGKREPAKDHEYLHKDQVAVNFTREATCDQTKSRNDAAFSRRARLDNLADKIG